MSATSTTPEPSPHPWRQSVLVVVLVAFPFFDTIQHFVETIEQNTYLVAYLQTNTYRIVRAFSNLAHRL